MGLALTVILALDGWLIYKRGKYTREIARLRAGMTTVERRKADLALASDEHRLEVMLALIRRQAQGDSRLHLAVSVDSGTMYLERDNAHLRDMRVEIGPEKWVGIRPDTVLMAAPRGARTVERILDGSAVWEVPRWAYADRGLVVPAERTLKGALGPVALVLNGGTVIYAMPSVGPLNDSSYVLPGSVRASAADLNAIVPNVEPGMSVYFY
jgi:hypothetical protein